MLQFDKSKATNTNAIYLDTVNTGSGYYDSLVYVYSQSFDNSNGTMEVVATSTPTPYRHYIILQNDGSDVPSPSGQYDFSLYTKELVAAIWGTYTPTWTATSKTWSEVGEDLPITLLYTDRAYVEGDNGTPITQYASSNENGTYTTYNG